MSQPSACRKTSGQETSTEVLTGEPDTSKGCLSGSEGRQRYSFPKGKESRALPYITEALNLNVGDVRQNGEVVDVLYLRRQTVKGKREGVALTLPRGAHNALAGYLEWKLKVKESLNKKAPLFVSRQGGRLTRQQAHNAFKKAYHKVGLKGQVTTHSPRKSYAKTVYEKSNNDLLVTQQALRHTSVEMTLYYLETMSDNVARAMPNYDFFEFEYA